MGRLVLLPGLGADARMFGELRAVVGAFEVPGWIEPRGGESLASYAERLARALPEGERPVLGGVSMGGMLALEMARHVPVRGVVLISSAMDASSLQHMRGLERASRALPARLMRRVASSRPMVRRMAGPIDEETHALYVRMVREMPASFLRWGMRAVLEWEGAPSPDAPMTMIHGDDDRLIPAPEGARLVRGGGHLCVMTHAAEVGDMLRAWLENGAA